MKIDVKVKEVEFGTSINEVVVPKILRKRVSTGIQYFDAVFCGWLNHINFLKAPS